MTNLPITASTPQAAASSKQTTNAADTGDAQNSQPFGDVLARQISNPNVKDAKADDKAIVDALAQTGTSPVDGKKTAADSKKDVAAIRKADIVPPDSSTALPTDMLAALLPQAMNTAATGTTTPKDAGSKPDNAAITASATPDKRGLAASKSDVVASVKADVTQPAATGINPNAQAKGQSFASTLADSSNRTNAGIESSAAARESSIAQTAPQPNAAALASLQNAAANMAAAVVQPVQVAINTPVAQDRWSDEFSQKITWLASSNKDQTAELHLNPPQLGPLDVVIKVSGDQATALFTSPHAAVRDAIEQAMPKLRDMLADNGIMLGNATVSDQAPRDQGQSSNAPYVPAVTNNDVRDTSVARNSAPRVSQISRHNGIVDTFA
ncbi:flagellar hook-length control protein FliK [Sideroxydans lithotrophicus]|uniref:Flagellar hook-length control protein n=1 Tax=Sideroxydans lithotrophicus (strain ES-1) TaxID=580332 RepID=D5CMZ7_SIDLE|nr:flagellar hook-length control protein FliK [Sideroxydans lithotrophicus]ADE10833.1 flagellar hook-length control protein [Sideroxydans lithotrophicus ES-1]